MTNLTPLPVAKMRTLVFALTLVACWLMSFNANALVTVTNPGNTTPALAATYPTLANAITALNATTGISGPVVITLTGNETAPLYGYSITAIPAGASAINNITIEGNGSTITAAAQTTGPYTDGIFKLIGADFITIQNFTMQENAGNTNLNFGMTEFGVALLCASPTNGAQNNIIQNNTISLNRLYANSFGIYSNTRHSATDMGIVNEATAASGSNSGNKIYGNNISNVNYGIVFIGAGTTIAAIDNGNDIGGNSAGTGNVITNWGGKFISTSFVSIVGLRNYGIFMNQQINDNISFNTVTSGALNQIVNYMCISKEYNVAPPTSGSFFSTINNNNLQLTINIPATNAMLIKVLNNEGLTTDIPGATISINNNNIHNCTVTTNTSLYTRLFFIHNNSIAGKVDITGNYIHSNALNCAAGSYGQKHVIYNSSHSDTLNINSNTIEDNLISAPSGTSCNFTSVENTGSIGVLGINNNIVTGITTTSNATSSFVIVNSGAIGTALNIHNNHFGNATDGFFTCTTGASGNLVTMYSVASYGPACVLSIKGNDIRGISFTSGSTVSFSGVSNFMGSLITANIDSNTFTNLNLQTSGQAIFISTGPTIAPGGTKTITGNSIIGSFTRAAGASSIICINDGGSSLSGTTSIITNNNFSNINVSGSSNITGISSQNGTATGCPSIICTGNIFNGWIGGSSLTGITCTRVGGTNSMISNNIVSNFICPNSITGISIGNSTNLADTLSISYNSITNFTGGSSSTGISCSNTSSIININNNTISSLYLTSTLTSDIKGISVSNATVHNIFKNKIYDLSGISTTSSISGLLLSGGTTNTIYNNIIGDLRTPAGNTANGLMGINLAGGTTANVYYNTVYLNASSTGGTFGSSALFANTSIALTLNNNILYNNSGTTGTGIAAAFRRSDTNLATYSATSNNNFLRGSTIFTDGTNSDVSLASYKTRVTPSDAVSISENLITPMVFLSTTGSSPDFLRLNPMLSTGIESGGAAITGITDDFDGDARNVSTPDIGADEFNGCFIGTNVSPATPSICLGQTQTLTANGAGAATWLWSTGATTQSLAVSPLLNTTYTVTITNGNGCTSSLSCTIVVNSNPTPSVFGNSSFCSGSSTFIYPTVFSGYSWSTGSTTQSISVNVAGTYTVTVTNSNGCTGSASKAITENASPTPSVSGNTPFCGGSSTILDAGSYSSYSWSTGATTQTISAGIAGTFTATVTDGNGCTGSASVATTINGLPVASFTVSCNPIFPGNTATLTSTSVAGSGTIQSYQWLLNGNSVGGATNATYITPANAIGNYSLVVTNSNNCSSTSAVTTLSNLSGPLAAGTYAIPSTCGFSSINAAVTYMNVNGLAGSAVFNVGAGYSETAPVGGITWNQCGLSESLKSGASQTVTFQKSGTGTNPKVYGYIGTGTTDAIIKIIGGDYLVFDGIDVTDSSAASFSSLNNQQMEYGYELLKCDGNNGSNYNTIKNCSITLHIDYPNTLGIYSGTSGYTYTGTPNDAVAVDASRNGHNSFYGIAFQSNYNGISLNGAAGTSGSISLGDTLNIVGLPAVGNTFVDFGGLYNSAIAINAINQQSISIDSNKINCVTSGNSYPGTETAINLSGGVSANIRNNILAFVSGWDIYGINCNFSAGALTNPNLVNITGNSFSGYSSSNCHTMKAIYCATSGDSSKINVSNNNLPNFYMVGPGTHDLFTISSGNNSGITCRTNSITNAHREGSGSYTLFSVMSGTQSKIIIDSNNISNNYNEAGSIVNCLKITSGAYGQLDITNNKINDNFSQHGNTLNGITASTGIGSKIKCLNNELNDNDQIITGFTLAMLSLSGSADSIVVRNNSINNNRHQVSGTFQGININTPLAYVICDSNTITGNYVYDNFSASNIIACSSINATSYIFSNNKITGNKLTGAASTPASVKGFIGTATNSETVVNNTVKGFSTGSTNTYINNMTGLDFSSSTAATRVVSGNTITNFYGFGFIITGIASGAGGTITVFDNKIDSLFDNGNYPIQKHRAIGIENMSGTSATYYNNYIGGLYVADDTSSNSVIGFSVTGGTSVGFYNNTIRLSGSGSTKFGSSGVSVSSNTALDMRNNIIVNLCTPGTTSGKAVAHRRSAPGFAGYATTSDNNLFYAGTPGANHLIYYDGTNSSQKITDYKTLVSTCDQHSKTENVAFISLVSDSANYLHINPSIASYAESGGANIAGITNDYDGDTRQGNAGYTGTGTAPDIGADEFNGIQGDVIAPAISYPALSNSSCMINFQVSATITDAGGVNSTAGMKPRLYFRKSTDANTYAGNTAANNGWKYVEASNNASPFIFTSDFSLLQSSVTPGDTIQYFVIAEDLAITPNTGLNNGISSSTLNGVALTAAAFPITGSINSTVIVAAPTPVITGAAIVCGGNPAILDAGSYSTYNWSTGATTQTISVNTAGTFTVTVTNAGVCTGSAQITTTISPGLSPSISGSTTFCAGSATTLDAGAFTSYNWSTGATTQTISVSTAGIFTVTVTNGSGCTGTAFATTSINANPAPSVSGSTSFCDGSSTVLNAGSYSSYNWSTGASTQTISVNAAGTFTVTVTNANGCTGSTSVSTTVNANPTPSISGSTSFCSGSSTILNAGSYSSYNWSTGATTQAISVSTSGNFTVTVTNGSGCTGSTSISTTVNANPNPSISGSLSFCSGSSTILNAGSYSSYNWSTGATTQTISANTAATFTVTVTNANGCTGSTSVTTSVISTLNWYLDVDNDGHYVSGPVAACSSPGAGYNTTATQNGDCDDNNNTKWLSASLYIDNDSDGYDNGTAIVCYGAIVPTGYAATTLGSDCNDTNPNINPGAIEIQGNGIDENCNGMADDCPPFSFAISGSASFCAGSSTVLNAGSYSSYSWSTGATTQTISVSTAGTFTVTVTNGNGCTSSSSFTTTVNSIPTPSISGNTSFCAGGSTILNAGTGYSNYNWSTGATTQTVSVSNAGTFIVTVSNGLGCTASASKTVTISAQPVPSISGGSSFCAPGSVALNAGAGYTGYAWSTGVTTQTINVSSPGTYTVTVTNAGGCSGSAIKVITGNALPAQPGAVTGATTICKNSNETYSIIPVPGATSYTWTATSGASVSSGQGSAIVVVNFSNAATSASISVVAVNACGNGVAKTLAYTVTSALPSQPAALNGQQYGVCNQNVAYNCPATVNASSYQWTVPAGVTLLSGQGTNAITVKYTSSFAGTGTISVAAVSGCGSSATISRTVNSKPQQPVVSGQNWACQGQTGLTYSVAPVAGATSYTWTVVAGSTIVSGQGTTSITVNWGNINGIIKCTANNACGNSIAGQLAVSFTCKEAANNQNFSELSLYPNPASTSATVQFDGFTEGNAQLAVYDLIGQQLINKDVEVIAGRNEYALDLTSLAKGTYMVRVVYDGVTRYSKLIVQ